MKFAQVKVHGIDSGKYVKSMVLSTFNPFTALLRYSLKKLAIQLVSDSQTPCNGISKAIVQHWGSFQSPSFGLLQNGNRSVNC